MTEERGIEYVWHPGGNSSTDLDHQFGWRLNQIVIQPRPKCENIISLCLGEVAGYYTLDAISAVLRVAHKGPASNGDNYCDGATLGTIIENIFLA